MNLPENNSANPAPMSTLQQVQTWLGTLATGNTVSVSADQFSSTEIAALYALIPAADTPITITITAIDVQNAMLTGTGTFLGEDDTTVAFVFTQPATTLLLQLNVTLPPALTWTLLQSYNVGFGSLSAQFIPNVDYNTINLVFAANVLAGTSLSIPITLNVATYSGDWLLTGNFTSVGNLAEDALTALAGNNNVLQLLSNYFDLTQLSITDLEIAFNPGAATCSMIRIGLSYATNWSFFNDKFVVQSINFDVEVFYPFESAATSVQGIVYAQMAIPTSAGSFTFDVGGQFPDNAVFAQIAPGSSLTLNEVFAFFQTEPPSGFPDISISTLSFFFWPGNSNFTFQLAITQPFAIIGDVNLDNFTFSMGVSNSGSNFTATGSLATTFTIGQTTLALGGSYTTGQGLSLYGSITDLPFGTIVTDIANQFNIEVPAPISQINIQALNVSLTTGQQNMFAFALNGTTAVAGVNVTFNAKINASWGTSAFTGSFDGTIVLQPSPSDTITFAVTFSETTTDEWIKASYTDSSTGLTFEDIAAVFGFQLPTIPDDLNLDLDSASLYYNFSNGSLAFGLQSKNYGNADFVTTVINSTRQYFFILSSNSTFSLSNLPLIGSELAQVENISIGGITVIIGSEAADTAAVTAFNALIQDLPTPPTGSYPLLPTTGTTGTFVLSAQVAFGSEGLPLMLSMGGTGAGTPPAQSGPPAVTGGPTPPGNSVTSSSSPDGTTWYTIQKSFGPVTFQRIGAKYQSSQQCLWFEIDASLALGPLTISMIGLGIGSSISDFSPQFSLQGMGIAYVKPPLSIAGSFVNIQPPQGLEFEGSVMIGVESFEVQAFGFYGNQTGAPSMFIFADVAGSFGGIPAFFLTGVALGFGYNSALRLPTINTVSTFPFIEVLPNSVPPNSLSPPKTPQDALNDLLNTSPPWVTEQQGPLWIAAGITFTSYDLVNSQALVIVETGADLTIALIGVSRAQFPQFAAPADLYAYLELDLEVILQPDAGVFSLEAVLSNACFLLSRSCVLTGGFAFYVWFGDNPHAGDFVITLGGYNPGFVAPSYYPTIPKVGFHWSLDSSISITGSAYLAFTPSVMMAGGELSAVFQAGNLKAWFDAHADVIIQWKPFWFDASIGITVGASYKVDLLLTSFTVSVELGCDLEFWGPPTGGSVSVDWYIISFSIPFGSSNANASSPLSWPDVQAMLPNAGTSSTPNILTLTPGSGLTPNTTQPGNANSPAWIVRGSLFGFSTSSSVPASGATVGSSYTFYGNAFNVAPLAWTGVTATHAVTIQEKGGGGDYSSAFNVVQVQQNLPSSLWGTQTTSIPGSSGQLVPNMITGVSAVVKPPQIGSSAGPVNVELYLEGLPLNLPGAVIGISSTAQPSGDVPVNSTATISLIANTANGGIASAATIEARTAIFTALALVGYQPVTNNDPMTNFADDISCAFNAEPMLVN